MEDQIFKDRQDRELSFKARNKAKRRRERLEQNRAPKWVPEGQFAPMVRFLKMFWINLQEFRIYACDDDTNLIYSNHLI